MVDTIEDDNKTQLDNKPEAGSGPGTGPIKILSPFNVGGKQGIIFGISVDGGTSQTSGWKIHSGSSVYVEGRGLEIFNRVSLGVGGAIYPGDNVQVNGSSLSFSVPNELDSLLPDRAVVILLFGDSKNVLNTRPLKQKFSFVHGEDKESEQENKEQKNAEQVNEENKSHPIISELINDSIGGVAKAFGAGLKNRGSSLSASPSSSIAPQSLNKKKNEEAEEEAEDENIDGDDSSEEAYVTESEEESEITLEQAKQVVGNYINNDVSLIVNPILRREVTEKLSGKQTGSLSVEAKTALKNIITQGASGSSNASIEVQEALKMVGGKESSLDLGLDLDSEESVEISKPSSSGSSGVEVTTEAGGSSQAKQAEQQGTDIKAKANRSQSGQAKQSIDASAPKQGAGSKKVEGGQQPEAQGSSPSGSIEGEEGSEASAGAGDTKSTNQKPEPAAKTENESKAKEPEPVNKPDGQEQQQVPPPLPQNAAKPKTPPPLPKSQATSPPGQSKKPSELIIDEDIQAPPPLPNQYSGILDQFKKNDSAAAQKIYGQGQSPEELLGAVSETPNSEFNGDRVNNTLKAAGKAGKQKEENETSSSDLASKIPSNNLDKAPQQNAPAGSESESQASDEQEGPPQNTDDSGDQTESKSGEGKKDKEKKDKNSEGAEDGNKNQSDSEDQAAQDKAGSQTEQQPVNRLTDELVKSQGLDEVVMLVNAEMNIYLNTAAGWIWAVAIPSVGLSLLFGAIAGDILLLLKNWLVKRAIGVVSVMSLSKAMKISDYSREEIAKKIKFSPATIANVVAMNVVALAAIFIIVVGVTTFLKIVCSPVKLVEGLPEVSTYQSVCNVVNNIPVGGPSPSVTPTPAPTPPINLR